MKMNQSEARAVLRAQGITNPSKSLIENWLRVQQYEEAASPPPAPRETVGDIQPCVSSSVSLDHAPRTGVPHPSSESNLEPLLRSRGELVRPTGRRKAGRPRIIASFYPALARAMADQTPLPKALRILGIQLDKRQVRALYRSREFKAMYQEARRQFLADYGKRSTQQLRKMRRYAEL